jgi:hypothetical protein
MIVLLSRWLTLGEGESFVSDEMPITAETSSIKVRITNPAKIRVLIFTSAGGKWRGGTDARDGVHETHFFMVPTSKTQSNAARVEVTCLKGAMDTVIEVIAEENTIPQRIA